VSPLSEADDFTLPSPGSHNSGNEVERLCRKLKGFRRIFSRFEKLDVIFLGFIHFALIVEALRFLISVNTP
jgi:hypothetical protein